VFKVAIADSRLVRFDDKEVAFRYRKVHSKRLRTMSLSVFEFMHRFLQHVLPAGFMKVRYFGYLSPSFAMSREEPKARVELAHGFALQQDDASITPVVAPAPLCCRHCGARLRYRRTISSPHMRAPSERRTLMLAPASG